MDAGVTAATTAGATAAAAIANAIKASGAIVRVEPEAFLEILTRAETPLVIVNEQKVFFKVSHQYLTSYRGFVFHAKSPTPLTIPDWCEVVTAKSVWIPM
jgi:ABC-type branched-subunit amino acid transport system substrate-binding protein